MSRRYIPGGQKDENGVYVKINPPKTSDISIDGLLHQGLMAIDKTMKAILQDVATGVPSRESIMNLKDCMAMLDTLKKREQEILENLTDEDLKKLADADK